MDFRFKEFLRYLIPGFFIFLQEMVFFYHYNAGGVQLFLSDNKDNGMLTILLFTVPIAAFFVGFFIEYIASNVEYLLYKWNILRRPSYIILNNKSERYRIAEYKALAQKLGVSEGSIKNNKDAKRIYIKASQNLQDQTYSEEFFYLMLVARNLFFTELILFIAALVMASICHLSWWVVGTLFVIALVLFHRWRQRSFLLTKHVLLQYLNKQ